MASVRHGPIPQVKRFMVHTFSPFNRGYEWLMYYIVAHTEQHNNYASKPTLVDIINKYDNTEYVT